MKVSNETHWDSKQLRALVSRIADAEPLLTREGKRRLWLVFKYKTARTGWCYGGHARYGTGDHPGRAVVLLPRERHAVEKFDAPQVASIIAHEIGHSVGLTHRDMSGLPKYTWAEGWREHYAFAPEIAPRAKREAPKKDARAKLEGMISRWQRKQKLASTMLKKWQRKLARLDCKDHEKWKKDRENNVDTSVLSGI